MAGSRYGDPAAERRPGATGADRRRPDQPRRGSLDAVRSQAGNAAVSSALEERDASPATVAARQGGRRDAQRTPVADAPLPIDVQHPRFDLRILGGTFDRILAGRRVRSARGFSESLAGRRGRTAVRVTGATGKSRLDPEARYAVDRRRATIEGQLDGFAGLVLTRRPRGEMPPEQRDRTTADLRGVPASSGQVYGRLRVRVGQVDLSSVDLPVQVLLDGDGAIRLQYRFRGWSLDLTGRQPGVGPGPLLDWRYVLTMPTARLAEGVWRDLPRRRRLGGAPPPTSAAPEDPPDGEGDDPPADGDDDDDGRSRR